MRVTCKYIMFIWIILTCVYEKQSSHHHRKIQLISVFIIFFNHFHIDNFLNFNDILIIYVL